VTTISIVRFRQYDSVSPGAGKSHLFEAAAEVSGGQCLKARHFLLTPAFQKDATLFIDALDETRAGRGDQDTINAFVKKLFEVGPAKVRISCRVADWLGDTDLAAFKPIFRTTAGFRCSASRRSRVRNNRPSSWRSAQRVYVPLPVRR